MSIDNEQELTLTADEIAIAEGREPEAGGAAPPQQPTPIAEAAQPLDDDGPGDEETISESDDDPKSRRKISYGALVKERAKNAERLERLEREREQDRIQHAADFARGEERMRQLAQAMEARQPKAEEPAAPPDISLDPLGRIAYLENLIKSQGEASQQQIQQTQETHVRSQVAQFAQADEQNARTQAPDFDDAKSHLLTSRGRELYVASGGKATDDQIRQQLAVEEEQLRVTAIQQGIRPSVQLYRMAIARGFTPKQAAAAPQAEQRIEAVAKAQDANRSLSTASTGASPKTYTYADIAAMPQDEFEAVRNRMGAKAFDAKLERLMGA